MELARELIENALRKGALVRKKEEMEYLHFREKYKSIPRGTVLVGKRTIEGYPKIARIFSLSQGLAKNLPNEKVIVEEKIDGYNVRAAWIGGKVVAFSRSGMVDYFACEKLEFLEPFFKRYPSCVICGELIGNTPYTAATEEYDVKFLIFDILDEDGHFVEVRKRHALVREWKLESVPLLGILEGHDADSFKKLAQKLNAQKKEGMVIKTPDRSVTLKYVTAWSDAHDIETAAALFDLPAGFFNQRLLRSSVFARENGIPEEEYAKTIGNALARRMTHETTEGAFEEFSIRIRDGSIWGWVQKHMSKEVRLEVTEQKKERGMIRIHFRKHYKKTEKTIRNALSGKKQED